MKNIDPIIELIRFDSSAEDGTFGVFMLQKKLRWACLEPYSRDNAKGISCINAGMYKLIRVNSTTYGPTFEVQDVENRTLIRLHWGNVDDDTEGCVLLGKSFGMWSNREIISNSRAAFNQFMDAMNGFDSATLIIKECY